MRGRPVRASLMDEEEQQEEVLLALAELCEENEGDDGVFHSDPSKQPKTVQDVINMFTECHFKAFFRFTPEAVKEVIAKLEIPEVVRGGDKRRSIDGGVAFLLLLFRMSHPVKLRPHMEHVFGYDKTQMCAWTNALIHHIADRWEHLLRMDVNYVSLHARDWARAVGHKLGKDAVARINCRCILFVDGVFRYCCRPCDYLEQLVLYNGYYGGHGLKYQAVTAPCGLILDLAAAVTGRHHDSHAWQASQVEDKMRQLPLHPTLHKPYYVYGDPAYKTMDILITAFKAKHLTKVQRACNHKMNAVRTSVEWGFRVVNKAWQALCFLPLEKIGLSPLEKRFKVAVLLTNVKTCVEGANQISSYFECAPPSLQEYVNMNQNVA